MSVEEAAIGIYRIAAAQITDLIHEITVERGLDPRDFVLHAFGGSCGLLCGVFGAELGVRRIVVPYTASVNAAFGLLSADIVHEYSVTKTLPMPSPAAEINEIYAPMVARAREQLAAEGLRRRRHRPRLVDRPALRTPGARGDDAGRGGGPMDDDAVGRLAADFEALYERKFGKGSAYRAAGMEMTMFRLTARGMVERPRIERAALDGADPERALIGKRDIFVEAEGGFAPADIYDFERLAPGNVVAGPAVIHTPITTIVVQAGQSGRVDAYRNISIELG